MGIPILQTEQVLAFIFVFLRIGAILMTIPVIGERMVPVRIKGGVAILLTLLLFPAVHSALPPLHAEKQLLEVVLAMTGEVLIGVIIGFAARIIFAGIQFAGEIIGIQMGFSIVNVIDPASSSQVSILAEFQYLMALLVYLTIDAHHTLISAIVDSYRAVAPFGYRFSGPLMQTILIFSKELFVTAIKVSAPVMAVMLFTNVAMGMMARAVPQMNVFVVGFPIYIAAGMTVFGLTIPIFVKLVQRALEGLNAEVYVLLRLM